jgi:hypothetical protein
MQPLQAIAAGSAEAGHYKLSNERRRSQPNDGSNDWHGIRQSGFWFWVIECSFLCSEYARAMVGVLNSVVKTLSKV